MLNIRKLEYLVQVAECGSVSEAAKRLYVSQPALSQSIHALEKEYGVPIFDRRFGSFTLTREGEMIVAAARSQLLAEQNLERQLTDMREGSAGRMVVGLSAKRTRQFLPVILPEFKARHPKLELVINTFSYSGYESMVLGGEVDFAFVMDMMRPEVPQGDRLVYEPIFRYQGLLAAPPNHPIAREAEGIFDWRLRPPIDLSRLKDEPFIVCSRGSRAERWTRSIFEAYGFQPNVALELTNGDVSTDLVEAGIGFALVQDKAGFSDAATRRGCYFLLDRPCSETTLCAIYRQDTVPSRAMTDFIGLIKEKEELGVWHQTY